MGIFSGDATRRKKKKAWTSDVKRGAKIKSAHKAEIERKRQEERERKQEERERKQEEALNKRIKKLKKQAELDRAETGVYKARTAKKKAKREARPSFDFGINIKKRKQGGTIKRRRKIGL